MHQPVLPLVVFSAGLIPVFVTPFAAIWYYGIYLVSLTNILLITGSVALFWVAGIVIPKLISDRKKFCRWLDRRTYRGYPHHCLSCRHLLKDPIATCCESCGAQTHRLDTERQGVAPPAEDMALQSLIDPSMTTYPKDRQRKDLTKNLHFAQRQHLLLEGFVVSLTLVLEGWLLWAILVCVIGYWIWQSWGTWWLMTLKIAAIVALYILVVAWIAMQPRLLLKAVKKYGPYGALPWCLSCDTDLHGNLTRDRDGRLKKRCAKCGRPVFEYEVDDK